MVDALDAFGEVTRLHVVVATHLEIEVSEHGWVVDEGGDTEGRVVVLLGLGVLFLRPHRPTAVAVGVHHTCGVGGFLKTSQRLLVLLEGILEEAVFEVHGAEVVAELAFQLDGLGGLVRALHESQPLQELLGGLLGAPLLAQLHTFIIEGLGLLKALGWAVAGSQRESYSD